MANTFKLTTNAGLTTSLVDQYTTPSSTTAIIVGMSISNTSANSITTDVTIVSTTSDNRRSGVTNETVHLVKSAPVPSGSSLEIMSGNKIVLETGDKIQALASTTGVADILISYMEIT